MFDDDMGRPIYPEDVRDMTTDEFEACSRAINGTCDGDDCETCALNPAFREIPSGEDDDDRLARWRERQGEVS